MVLVRSPAIKSYFEAGGPFIEGAPRRPGLGDFGSRLGWNCCRPNGSPSAARGSSVANPGECVPARPGPQGLCFEAGIEECQAYREMYFLIWRQHGGGLGSVCPLEKGVLPLLLHYCL